MAKSTGITTTFSVDDAGGVLRNISNDVLSFNISTPRGVFDVTGLDKSAIERLLGLSDGQVTITMAFNPTATTGQHAVFRTAPSSSVARTVTIVINSTPTATLSMEMVISEYVVPRGQDGNIQPTATLQLADGTVPTWS